jgi:hypothetical protein
MDERRATQKPGPRQPRGASSENETFLPPGREADKSMNSARNTAQARAASRGAADVWALTLDDDQCAPGSAFYDE